MNLRSFVTYSWKMRQGADCPAAATSSRLVVAMVETTCTGTQQLAGRGDRQQPAHSMLWARAAPKLQTAFPHVAGSRHASSCLSLADPKPARQSPLRLFATLDLASPTSI